MYKNQKLPYFPPKVLKYNSDGKLTSLFFLARISYRHTAHNLSVLMMDSQTEFQSNHQTEKHHAALLHLVIIAHYKSVIFTDND